FLTPDDLPEWLRALGEGRPPTIEPAPTPAQRPVMFAAPAPPRSNPAAAPYEPSAPREPAPDAIRPESVDVSEIAAEWSQRPAPWELESGVGAGLAALLLAFLVVVIVLLAVWGGR
ncbi:MAG: hypothetical protein IT337_07205, partial [Thermomicrobiales bacterium]|nr:hypothetical protein [Thermomicrobiales bacterium]